MVNNIPFSWKFLCLTILINVSYMLYNIYYTIENKQIKSFDWNSQGKIAVAKAVASIIITTSFFLIVRMANKLKY
jgi:hypothetical protein